MLSNRLLFTFLYSPLENILKEIGKLKVFDMDQ